MPRLKCIRHKLFANNVDIIQSAIRNRFELLAACNKMMMNVRTQSCVKYLNDKLTVLGKLFGKQCNAIAAQRVRRANQIMLLYNDLYGDKYYRLFRSLGDILKKTKKHPLSLMLGAALFSWDDEKVTDNDLQNYVDDMKEFWDNHDGSSDNVIRDHEGHDWEKVVDHESFKLWRSPVPNSHLYQYKAYGTYKDIPARAFFNVQIDLEYRKEWDSHVIKIEKVDEDKETGSEIIYWATHFPLGFIYSRDYVYVRRHKVDRKNNMMILTARSIDDPSYPATNDYVRVQEYRSQMFIRPHKSFDEKGFDYVDRKNNMMILTARSIDHPSYPATNDYVRVQEYRSQMFIRPHKSFDEKGFDYVMSYFDDPQLSVPYWAVNRMTVSSLPSFVGTLHDAAKKFYSRTNISSFKPVDNQGTIQDRLMEARKQYNYANYEQEKS